jgi:hypothetical protein
MSISKHICALATLVMLLLLVTPTLAQTQEIEMNGFTATIPADWIAEATIDEGVVFGNSEAAVRASESSGDEVVTLNPGEVAIVLVALPPEDLAGVIPAGAGAREVLETFLSFFNSETEIITVSGLPYEAFVAEAFTEQFPTGRAYLYVLDVGGTFVLAAAVSGDQGDGVRADAEAILATMTYESPSRPVPIGAIAYGDEVSGELTNAAPSQAWTFVGEAGDRVTITMEAGDSGLDTSVTLFGQAEYFSNSFFLMSNDDSFTDTLANFTDSQIFDFPLPQDDIYVIEAGRFSGEGTYTLRLERAGEGDSDAVQAETSATVSEVIVPKDVLVGGAAPLPTPEPLVLVDGQLRQWAADASGSSQYGTDSWGFIQATGEPDTTQCGDIPTAWASSNYNGQDFLSLSYDVPVTASEINIYQTYNPGSIVRVVVGNSETLDTFELPNSADSSGTTTCPGVFTLIVEDVPFAVDTVTIYVDQTIMGNWNEIDAVELVGTP